MDEKELIDGLRGLTLAEPRLGFDPDQLADRSARKQHTFRQVVATSAGTLVVAGLAVGTLLFVAAGQSLPTTPGGATTQPTPQNEASLSKPAARIKAHLLQVLPTILPEAKDLQIKWIAQPKEDRIRAEVEFRSAEGLTGFCLDVLGPISSIALNEPSQDRCGGERSLISRGSGGLHVDDGTLHEKYPQSAADYRKNGGTVFVMNGRSHQVGAPEDNPEHPLTKEQLIALATDPALSIE